MIQYAQQKLLLFYAPRTITSCCIPLLSSTENCSDGGKSALLKELMSEPLRLQMSHRKTKGRKNENSTLFSERSSIGIFRRLYQANNY